jgi:hypothetical protein
MNLSNTKVSDAGLKYITGLKELTELGLVNTKVSEKGLKELRNMLPKCNIRR